MTVIVTSIDDDDDDEEEEEDCQREHQCRIINMKHNPC
jgi:hypothetical protein